MVRLPKIAIGTNKRKAHFDLSHDDETSSDFGFCQPTVVRHVNAGSSSTLKTSIGVRLSPLPCPTFGRIKLKTFNTLVPMREVFEAFDYFIKGTSVASAFKTYVPKAAPSLPAFTLRDFIFMQSLYEWSKMCDVTGDLKIDTDCDAFLNLTWLAPSLRGSNIRDTGVIVNDKHVYEFIDATLVPIGSVFDGVNDTEIDGYAQWFFTQVSNNLFTAGENYRYRNASLLLGVDSQLGLNSAFNTSFMNVSVPQSCLDGSRDFRLNTVRRAFYANRPTSSAYDMCLTSTLTTIDVDFVAGETSCTISIPCGLFANWTKRGQRLFKVLNAIGIRGFMYDDAVDLPKFYAYYKAWFDNLNPGRNQQWRETSCFRLIHSYYDLNVSLYDLMLNQPTGMPMTKEEVQRLFAQFLVDVSNCCYVLPVDNFTAATPDSLQQVGSIEPISLSNGTPTNNTYVGLVTDDPNHPYPYINTGTVTSVGRFANIDQSLNGLVISSLLRLYKLANKNSVIGARIEDYLKTKYGYTIAQSHKLNGSEMSIKIEEIFANAGTSENRLGEIGGRGSNANANKGICKFDVDENSIFVQFVAIVPYGDYCQGNIRAKVTKNDFYQEVYDSMGKEKYSMSELMSRCSDLTYRPNPASFGSVPMLWRDKVQNSMHNGAFALPSQRALFLPYSLDRLFNETELRLKTQFIGGIKNITLERVAGTVLTPSEELRYIGRTPDYGNYDRIFYDNTGYYDNFILHVVQDWDYYATMKPISQSFDTFDDDNDESVTTITAS